MDEQRLRERLTGLANAIPPVGSAPPGLIPKARRRAYVMPALALLCVIAAAVVTFAGVRAVLGAQASVPAVPRPDQGAAREDHVIVVFDRSGRPGLAAAADADGEPAGYTVIRPEGNLWPLDRTDDGRLAFTGFDRQGLFVLELDGRVTTVVPTGNPDGRIYGASWSPDGARLVYSIGADVHRSLHVISDDGSDDRLLLDGSGRWPVESPSWSPDGSTIAYVRGDNDCGEKCQALGRNELELWAMDADGSDARPLVRGLHVSGTPAWSPDGSSIAIAANGADRRPHVFVLSLSSGEVRQLTDHVSRAPVWSPDGGRIAFLARDLSPWRVYINESDGGSAGEVVTPPIWVGSTLLWDDAPIP
jgi:dipeptidyl aminopeptidase/acylaminoacyl peptidase